MRRVALVLACGLIGWVAPVSGAAASPSMLVRMPLHARSVERATTDSTNWSGYAAYNATFSDVQASWTQPKVTCSTSGHRYASFWVGLDGYTSNSVEQIGTDSDCSGRRAVYYAWYEMYPAYSVTLSQTSNPVVPGDSMSAEVSTSATTFTLTLHDSTQKWIYSTTQASTTAQDSSAEWVAEAPSSCYITCSVLPLANFGTVNFSTAVTTGNGQAGTISTFTNSGIIKAQPSALGTNGSSFTVTWHHS